MRLVCPDKYICLLFMDAFITHCDFVAITTQQDADNCIKAGDLGGAGTYMYLLITSDVQCCNGQRVKREMVRK